MQIATWGTRFFKADAQKCADEIMEICDKLESATPQEILEKARDSSTELHKCFTWDDTVASEKWRLHEARNIVCNLKIVDKREDKKSEVVPIRVFYKTDDQSGYKPTKLILKKPDEYKALVERCRSELLAIKQKFQNISEFDEIWELIN
jgi:hypothetical protein|nr:MAG TPA: hypothetical protein [Caudoviricetes sp.]